MLVHNVFVQGL